jgi:gliding motility-associated-like protein
MKNVMQLKLYEAMYRLQIIGLFFLLSVFSHAQVTNLSNVNVENATRTVKDSDKKRASYTILSDMKIAVTSQKNTVCNGFGCNYVGPSILINEVMLSPTTKDGSIYGTGPGFNPGDNEGEWIELYNPDECQSVDISCYFLGNNAVDGGTNHPGGFLIPEGTIIPPQGFCLIRGVNAPAVAPQHLIQNGGKTVEIVVNNIARICLGSGQRLWFPNAGGWFAFYDRNGVPQDAISWASQTNSCMTCAPCNPGAIGACNYTGALAPYNSIPASRKTYISSSTPPSGLSYRRVPDGGNWAINSAANPTLGFCNSVCNPEPIITCTGTVTATVTDGQAPYTYKWNDGMAQTTQTATGLCAGTYCVTVTDATNSIITACVTVVDHTIDVTITSNNDICEGETLTFGALANPSTPKDTYTWTGPNSYTSSNSSNEITNATPNMSGSYSVTVIDEFTCSGNASVVLNVMPSPTASFSGNPKSGCAPVIVQFNDVSTGGNIVQWNWNFGDGNTSTQQNPTHNYTVSGQYDVQLIVTTDKGCTDTLVFINYVEVYPQPIADFYTVPEIGKTYKPTITFYSNSNAQYWSWDFGDGNTSTSPPPVQNTYPDIDSAYTVILILSNDYGCSDTITKEILIIDDILTFPNIITPNGDGINDYLVIVNGEKYPNNKLVVFNRWGKIVFEQMNYNNDWNGGNLADGTYYYIFYYLDKTYTASLTILRN